MRYNVDNNINRGDKMSVEKTNRYDVDSVINKNDKINLEKANRLIELIKNEKVDIEKDSFNDLEIKFYFDIGNYPVGFIIKPTDFDTWYLYCTFHNHYYGNYDKCPMCERNGMICSFLGNYVVANFFVKQLIDRPSIRLKILKYRNKFNNDFIF